MKKHTGPLYVQERPRGKPAGPLILLTAYVRDVAVPPVISHDDYSREQRMKDPELQKRLLLQDVREMNRRYALDSIVDVIERGRPIDVEWIQCLYPADLVAIDNFGDAYLLQLTENASASSDDSGGLSRSLSNELSRRGTDNTKDNRRAEYTSFDLAQAIQNQQTSANALQQNTSMNFVLEGEALRRQKEKAKEREQELLCPRVPEVPNYTPRTSRGLELSR